MTECLHLYYNIHSTETSLLSLVLGNHLLNVCLCVQEVYTVWIQCSPTFDSLFTVYIAHNIISGISKCWNIGNRSSALKMSTWTSWSLPAPASPLWASVSPPPCSCCLLCRPSDSSDYEHKSSTCQELLLPGLCNVPAFIWRWCEQEIAAMVCIHFNAILAFLQL
jgi:hypothetical protein